jgi:hypothetical protein
MRMAGGARKAVLIESLIPQLEADGFQVFVQPPAAMLPPFLQGMRPDVIALKAGQKLAVEVVTGDEGEPAKAGRLAALMAGHAEWQFRVFYAPADRRAAGEVAPSREAVSRLLDRLPDLHRGSGALPALLTAWAAFEAAGRIALGDAAAGVMDTARLIEALAHDGLLTPDEADWVRSLAQRRNGAAHGDLAATLAAEELSRLIELCRMLLDPAEAGAAPH